MQSELATNLVRRLVDAAYDCGYYSGTKSDGSVSHKKAIAQREALRKKVIQALVASGATLGAQSVPAEEKCND